MKRKFFLFAILMLAQLALAETFYVNDDGNAQGCDGYDYTTISEALAVVETSDRIIICDGTYNEEIEIKNAHRIFIIGECEGCVKIIGSSGIVVDVEDSSWIALKNLDVENGYRGIQAKNVSQLTLENIHAKNIVGIGPNYPHGIYLYKTPDWELQGNILIEDVSGLNTVAGIMIRETSGGEINTDSFEINTISTTSYVSWVYGLRIENSVPLTINGDINVNSISSSNNGGAVGVSFDNSTVTIEESIDVSYISSEGYTMGLWSVNSIVTFKESIDVSGISSSESNAMGVSVNGGEATFEALITVTDVEGRLDTYGLSALSCENLKVEGGFECSDVVCFSPNSEAMGVSLSSSKASIDGITDNGGTDESIHMKNSEANISFFEANGLVDTCIYMESSNAELSGSDLSDCNQLFLSESDLDLFDTPLDAEKISSDEENSTLWQYKQVSFSFLDNETQAITPDQFLLDSASTELDQTIFPVGHEKEMTLPIQKIVIEQGSQTVIPYPNYTVAVSKDGYCEAIKTINLGDANQTFEFTLTALPAELEEMEVYHGDSIDIMKYFTASEKDCSSQVPGELHKCYELGLPYEFQGGVDYVILFFTVPTNWLQEKMIPNNNVDLYHYADLEWIKLETTLIETGDVNNQYTAKIISFSNFAVSGEPVSCMDDSDCKEDYSCKNGVCECSMTCSGNKVLDPQECECVGPEEEPPIEQPPEQPPEEPVPEEEPKLNETNVTIEEPTTGGTPTEPESEQNVSSSSRCNINCPPETFLDESNCVCIAQQQQDYTLIILLVAVIIVLAIFFTGLLFLMGIAPIALISQRIFRSNKEKDKNAKITKEPQEKKQG
ncbi:PGF-pre-PGF domain-containing protein [archaeon]|nr:PGF-pre-PGF domain-containing protein [archaeon]